MHSLLRGDRNCRNQPENPHYLILNYEIFQQPNSANWVRTLINNQQIDFIVIDEIHYTKQRQVEDMSRRKQLVSALITAAATQSRFTRYRHVRHPSYQQPPGRQKSS